MDDTEKWTLKTHRGTDMFQVHLYCLVKSQGENPKYFKFQTLVHEIGHSLGLSHSDVREAIMAPFHKVPASLHIVRMYFPSNHPFELSYFDTFVILYFCIVPGVYAQPTAGQ